MEWSLVAALIGAATLLFLYGYERGHKKRTRSNFFSDCLSLLDSYRVVQEGLSYPILAGRYRGYDIRLEPVIDHMAWRKLPVLWLKATVLTDIPHRGVVDLLIRPHGAENFSPSQDLEHDVKIPAAWPQDAILTSDAPEEMPPLGAITRHLAIFSDDRIKELVVTPKGVRLVARIWQAVRAHYITFREIKFPGETADRELVQRLLDTAIAVAESLGQSSQALPGSVSGERK